MRVSSALEAVRRALRERNVADLSIEKACREAFRYGDIVAYAHGNNMPRAMVVSTAGDRVQVESLTTRRCYWIYASAIEGHFPESRQVRQIRRRRAAQTEEPEG